MLQIRKIATVMEETWMEGGVAVDRPIKMAAVLAVITNPWISRGFVRDLGPEIRQNATPLAEILISQLSRIVALETIEAYGKAALVGINGEIEHASAFIHTLRFGDVFRRAVNGTSILSFTNARGTPGHTVTIPMVHKTEDWRRSHFLTLQCNISDAPGADEIIVALGVSDGGRPHPRLGDRHQDELDLESL